MSRFVLGVLWSEALALWVEFFYKIGATFRPDALMVSIPFYCAALIVLHRTFDRLNIVRGYVPVCFVLGGIVGLVIEWTLVGNSPRGNPQAFQTAQFLFHAVYPILGYLVVRDPSDTALRKSLQRYLVLATVVTALGFVFPRSPMRMVWFLFLPIATYVGLCYFVFRWPTNTVANRAATTLPRSSS